MAARIDLPDLVTTEYSDESRLAVRFRPFREYHDQPAPEQRLLELVAGHAPKCVLEVGCGEGLFSRSVVERTGAAVTAVDQSARMVEIARGRGVDAMVADVQELPFDDASFDMVVANWMLYHVPDVSRALAEIRRVLRPGGSLLAVTMGDDMMHEVWSLTPEDGSHPQLGFSEHNGAELLGQHFDLLEEHELVGHATFPSRDAVVEFVESTLTRAHRAVLLPEWDGPLRATVRNVAFVATR
jgi:SAM-dependent methyltransferase